jgi:hypothetical protein
MAVGVQINFKSNKREAIQLCTAPSQGQCQQPDFLFYFLSSKTFTHTAKEGLEL